MGSSNTVFLSTTSVSKKYSPKLSRRSAIALAWLTLALGASSPAQAEDFSCIWNAANADWDQATEWSNCDGGIPNNGANTFDANISGGVVDIDTSTGAIQIEDLFLNNGTLNVIGTSLEVTGTATVNPAATFNLNGGNIIGGTWNGDIATTASTNSTIQSTLTNQYTNSAGSTVTIGNNSDLNISGVLNNNGLITFDLVGANVDSLEITSTAELQGNGSVVLNAGTSRIDGGGTLIHGANHRIEGQGNVGANQTSITNNGVIDANVNGGLLTIDTSSTGGAAAAALVNNNLLRASNGGTLSLANQRIDNSSGVIEALTNSVVRMESGIRIDDGTLRSSGTGFLTTAISSNVDIANVTIDAGTVVQIENNSDLNVRGTVTNNGQVTYSTVGAQVDSFEINDNDGNSATIDLNLIGDGRITLTGASTHRIDGNGLLQHGADHTIEGFGNVGSNGLAITNLGLITANQSGDILTIDTRGTGASASAGLINDATVRAENGGVLRLANQNIDNTNGTIEAVTGGIVRLASGLNINNGLITNDASGRIETETSSNVDFTDVQLSSTGQVVIGNNADLHISGTVDNDGTITFATVGAQVDSLEVTGTLNLNGSGNVAMIAGPNQIDGNGTLIHGSNHRIEGTGNVGANTLTVVNNGLIDANINNTTLIIDGAGGGTAATASITNNAVMRASNGGTLEVRNSRVDNTNGTISALDGSAVRLVSGLVLEGGTLSTTGSGEIFTDSSSNVDLANVDIAIGSTVAIGNNADLHIDGTINNNGTITFATVGAQVDSLEVETGNTATLAGTGNVLLVDLVNRLDGGGTLIQNAGHTIEGRGNAGGNTLTIENAGLISANVDNNILTLDTAGTGANTTATMTNTGTLRAENGGTLNMANARYDNTSTGTIEALDDSTVSMASGAVLDNNAAGDLTGGTYRSVATGNGSLVSLNGDAITTNSAEIVLSGAGSALRTRDGNSATSFTQIEESLTNNSADGVLRILDNRDYNSVGNLTNNGEMQLGGGTFDNLPGGSLVNTGEIHGFGTIVDQISQSIGSHTIARGGNLTVQAFSGNQGDVTIDGGASLTINSTSSAFNLTHNGTDLDVGANLFNVRNDYNNASFGSGNAFDARANVTGTGEIRATNATQEITGAGITNGSGPIVNLTLGNIREGGTASAGFQVNNNGIQTTLRGAVQNTNAGDLNVTATDFALAAGGGNTGTINVGVNAGAAGGALTGTIDVVNNFDNVVNQQINIVNSAVYELAEGQVAPTTVAFGNYRVGTGALSQDIEGTNLTAANGGFAEGLQLNANSTGTTGITVANNAGDGSLIDAGQSRANALVIAADGTTVGNIGGSVNVDFVSDGAGTSGFADIGVGSQAIAVSGTGFNAAQAGPIATVDFGNFLISAGPQSANLTINNTAAPGLFSEDLNAGFGLVNNTGVGAVTTNGGFINGLLAGSSDNTSMSLMVDPTSVGAISGSVAINFASAGEVNGVSNGLGTLTLPDGSASFVGTISGTAGTLASPSQAMPNPITGNVRVGTSISENLSITNNAVVGEGLNAQLSGGNADITAGGSFVSLATQTTSTTDLTVDVDTATAGNKSGSATLALQSDGTFNNGTITNLTSQQIDVDVNVYNAADRQTGEFVDVGNYRVGDGPVSATLDSTNTAAAGAFTEDLRVDVTGSSANVNATGNGALVAGGATATVADVEVDGTQVGNFFGTVAVDYVSDGTNTSGLADLAIGSNNIDVVGTGFNAAEAGPIATVDFGNFLISAGPQSANLVINNAAAPGAFSEDLNASFGLVNNTGAGVVTTNGGTINGLLAGASDNTSMGLMVDPTGVGAISGNVIVNFATAGAVNGVSNGLGVAALPDGSANFVGTITGTAGTLAMPSQAAPNPVTGAIRVGDTLSQNLSITNNAVVGEGLNAQLSTAATNFAATGNFAGLSTQDTNNTDLNVTVMGNSSGNVSGVATLALQSDGTFNNGTITDLQSQNINVDVDVYAYAEAEVQPSVLNFGTVRVGDTVAAQDINLSNVGTGALVDDLGVTGTSIAGPFIVNGVPVAIGAGQTTALQASLDTSIAGSYNSDLTLDFVSTNGVIADADLDSQLVNMVGTVNNLADVLFSSISGDGTLSGTGTNLVYDFGNVQIGTTVNGTLGLANAATGPADNLSGMFSGLTGDFALAGFDDVIDLIAGDIINNLMASISSSTVQFVQQSVSFAAISTFTGLADLDLDTFLITFQANFVDQPAGVPESSAGVLLLIGFLSVVVARRRKMAVGSI